ncbi:hypothetical protein BH012_20510 [Salmonella enterica]|nr:hypothetical protein [Salmonella enterica]EAX6603678.1 hypothetical protein [Salmonella enterica]
MEKDIHTLIIRHLSREVRRVPVNWVHPKGENGKFIPLLDRYNRDIARWDEGYVQWQAGYFRLYNHPNDNTAVGWATKTEMLVGLSYTEWAGPRPQPENYIPDWPDKERTHFQMYETVSEGTPVSPVLDAPEALARWLTDNRASLWGNIKANYEDWLDIINSKID